MKSVTIAILVLLTAHLVQAKIASKVAAPVTAADLCQSAAEEVVERIEKAEIDLESKQDPESNSTFDGVNGVEVDEADPTIFHVSYGFNEECLGGDVVKTHLSADGLSCKAEDKDVSADGSADCG